MNGRKIRKMLTEAEGRGRNLYILRAELDYAERVIDAKTRKGQTMIRLMSGKWIDLAGRSIYEQ